MVMSQDVLVVSGDGEVIIFALDEGGIPIGLTEYFTGDCDRDPDNYDAQRAAMPVWIRPKLRADVENVVDDNVDLKTFLPKPEFVADIPCEETEFGPA
jgi:hypothetical protein